MTLHLDKLENALTPWLQKNLQRLGPHPRFRVVSAITAGLLVVFLFRWAVTGSMLGQQALWFLTIPGLLYAFLFKFDKENDLLYHGVPARGVVIAGSGFLLALCTSGIFQTIVLAVWVVAAMFTFIHYHEFRRLVLRHVFVSVAALAGALSGMFYYIVQLTVWKWFAAATANTVFFLLSAAIPHMMVFAKGHRPPPPPAPVPHLGYRVHVMVPRRVFVHPAPPPHPVPAVHDSIPDFMAVASDHFALTISAVNNVTTGIFLFLLLFSVELVLSGRQLLPKRMLEIVAAGIVLIFMTNALTMTLYFYLGNMAMAPGSSGFIILISKIMGGLLSEPLLGFLGYLIIGVACLRLLLGNVFILNYRRA